MSTEKTEKTEKIAKTENQLLDEAELALNLIEAQYLLKISRDQKNAKTLVILVNGMELTGKGQSVN